MLLIYYQYYESNEKDEINWFKYIDKISTKKLSNVYSTNWKECSKNKILVKIILLNWIQLTILKWSIIFTYIIETDYYCLPINRCGKRHKMQYCILHHGEWCISMYQIAIIAQYRIVMIVSSLSGISVVRNAMGRFLMGL